MHGVSEVIAIILILMITIAIAGLAYTFMSSTMASTTSYASSAVDTTTSSMMTAFTIENMDVAKVYLRNTGQNTLSSLSVYVNDEPAIFSITPTTIAPGQIGTITIYSFIPDGSTVKVVSSNGFSTSKVAQPCSKSVGCWKFDEGSGTTAYDSSPSGNSGTLTNGPIISSGKYGNALSFDGINDYVNAGNSSSLTASNAITISAWIKQNSCPTYSHVTSKRGSTTNYAVRFNSCKLEYYYTNSGWRIYTDASTIYNLNEWYYITVIHLYSSGEIKFYKNGALVYSTTSAFIPEISVANVVIGAIPGAELFNGTIDEVRIYNKAIY